MMTTHIFLLKKFCFALVIVFGYGNINWQITILMIIHFLLVIYKLVINPYYLKFANIITSLGDISFLIVLGLKLNDLKNLNKSNNQSDFEIWTT